MELEMAQQQSTNTQKTTNQQSQNQQIDLDSTLMQEVASGSEHALRMLIEKWKNPLVNFIYASTRDYHLAEDIAIITFQKLYNARHSYKPTAKFSTFLFRIAHNETINEFRKNQIRPADPTDMSELSVASPEDTSKLCTDISVAFTTALEKLPAKQRTAISLLVQEELSYAEIADIMGETVQAVKTLINRARSYLREALKEYA